MQRSQGAGCQSRGCLAGIERATFELLLQHEGAAGSHSGECRAAIGREGEAVDQLFCRVKFSRKNWGQRRERGIRAGAVSLEYGIGGALHTRARQRVPPPCVVVAEQRKKGKMATSCTRAVKRCKEERRVK